MALLDQAANTAGAPLPSPSAAPPSGAPPSGAPVASAEGEPNASPEEQQEYERALGAISQVIYGDDRSNESIMKAMHTENKVGSIIKAASGIIVQVDGQIQMDEVVIPQITQDVVNMLMELAETKEGIEFDETEMKQALSGTWEAIMQVFGGDEEMDEDFEEMTRGMSGEDMRKVGSEYNDLLNYGEGPGDLESGQPTGIGAVTLEEEPGGPPQGGPPQGGPPQGGQPPIGGMPGGQPS